MIRPIAAAALAALSLAGCSESPEERAQRRADAFANNMSDRLDRWADRIGAEVDNAADRVVDDHADRIEARVRNETDRAANEAGAALERVGNSLRRDERPAREAPADRR